MFVTFWLSTLTPIDSITIVALHMYWPASAVPIGFSVIFNCVPPVLATTPFIGCNHSNVGSTARLETTDTIHSRDCSPPALMVQSIVVDTTGASRAENKTNYIAM